MKRYCLKKSQKLRKREQFKAVLDRRCGVKSGFFNLYIARNRFKYPRFGISVGKNTGSAVLRNRLKRLAREVFRLEQYNIPAGCDYLLIFSGKMSKNLKSKELEKLTFVAFRKAFLTLAQTGCRRLEIISDDSANESGEGEQAK